MQFKSCDKSKGYVPNNQDFIDFSNQIYESLDFDPVYPVLSKYFDMRGFNIEEKLFGVHLYLTIYSTYWTLYFLERYPRPYSFKQLAEDNAVVEKKVSIGTDRRGVAWAGLARVFPEIDAFYYNGSTSMTQYFTNGLDKDFKTTNMKLLKPRVLAIPYNGPWAAFKHLDLLLNCVGLPIEFSDWWVKGRPFGGKQLVIDMKMGLGHKLGHEVKETKEIVDMIDEFSHHWTREFQENVDTSITYDISETFACKYHATYQGTYYPGHDIDKMQKEICGYDTHIDDIMYDLRELCFDKKDLGELSSWKGVRNQLKGKIIIIDKENVTMAKQAISKCQCQRVYEKAGYDTTGCNGCDQSSVDGCIEAIAGMIKGIEGESSAPELEDAGLDQVDTCSDVETEQWDAENCPCKLSYIDLGYDVSTCDGCDGSCAEDCQRNIEAMSPPDEEQPVVEEQPEAETEALIDNTTCPYRAIYEFNQYDTSGCDSCMCGTQLSECFSATSSLPQPEVKEQSDAEETLPGECQYKTQFIDNGYDVSNCEGCDCSKEQMNACNAVLQQQ